MKSKQVHSIPKCIDCLKPFTLERREVAWFRDMALEIPKRCPECRVKKRIEKVKETLEYGARRCMRGINGY